jgi:hypothetical protein
MGEEVTDLRSDDEQSLRNLDEVSPRIAAETPQRRALRRWTAGLEAMDAGRRRRGSRRYQVHARVME